MTESPGSLGVLLVSLAVMAWPGAGGIGSGRLSRVCTVGMRTGAPRRRGPSGWNRALRLHAVAAVVVVAGLAVFGPTVGTALGLGGAVAVEVVGRRREPAAARAEVSARERALPWALELIAVGVQAGAPPTQAIRAAADAIEGSLGAQLREIAALTALGAPPALAWEEVSADPVLAPVARAMGRAEQSGSALASSMRRTATDRRAAIAERAEAAIARVGVFAMLPLGLCFLPAFICIGVVPIVVGVLGHALR